MRTPSPFLPSPNRGLQIPGKTGLREFERYPSGVTVFQSVIATIVGADLWRLAHRRNAPGDGRNISVSLAVGDYDVLGCRLEALAADKGAFVSHIKPDLRGGIEITAV